MRDQGDERTSFQTLIDMGKLPADALLSPTKMKEGFYSKTLHHALQFPSGDSSGGGCQGDVQKVPQSDQHLSNFWYGKAGNSPNGEKADFIEGLDANDEIKIIGVFTPDISVVDNVTARGVTGIGIYAKGTLEAVYTGGNLSTSQIQNMTTGDGSTTAMNNRMWSYWGDNTVPALQS